MSLENDKGQLVLVHHGVKGQKWGARRKAVKASNARSNMWNQKYINRASMSNKDLKANVTRLNLENQFRDAVIKNNSASQSKGKKWLSSVSKSVLNTTVSSVANTGLNAAISALKDRALNK